MTAAKKTSPAAAVGELGGREAAELELARQLAERAQAEGLSLTGPGGLLGRLTKVVLEGALEGEMDARLGYAKHDPAGRDGQNSRNGHRAKTVLTDVGPVQIDMPRDRDASFAPKIVAKRQRRLGGVDDMVISLVAKGLTTGEVRAHLAEVYGAEVSRDTISAITDRVLEDLAEWQSRPLEPVYAVLFIDVINVKIRDGQVANRPIYVILGVTADGERDIVGLRAGEHGDGEGAKYWLRVLAEVKNRGTNDVHLLRNSFRYASRRDWEAIAKALRPVYTAPSESAALDAFAEFSGTWESKYPAIVKLRESAWAEFVPFLRFDRERSGR
jgi:putative transposase